MSNECLLFIVVHPKAVRRVSANHFRFAPDKGEVVSSMLEVS